MCLLLQTQRSVEKHELFRLLDGYLQSRYKLISTTKKKETAELYLKQSKDKSWTFTKQEALSAGKCADGAFIWFPRVGKEINVKLRISISSGCFRQIVESKRKFHSGEFQSEGQGGCGQSYAGYKANHERGIQPSQSSS